MLSTPMNASRRAHRWSWIFLIALAIPACNAISGVDEYTFDRVSGFGGGGGGDAGVPCNDLMLCGDLLAKDGCTGCAIKSSCAVEFDACDVSSDCRALIACITTCSDAACTTSCQDAHMTSVTAYENVVTCVRCACSKPCGVTCTM